MAIVGSILSRHRISWDVVEHDQNPPAMKFPDALMTGSGGDEEMSSCEVVRFACDEITASAYITAPTNKPPTTLIQLNPLELPCDMYLQYE